MADAATADVDRAACGHRGTRAVQRMVEHAPSSGGLALWVKHADLPADPAADAPGGTPLPPAWTDGHTVHYRPAFAKLPLPLQAGWVAHEVLHIALRHGPRFLALQARLGQADLQLFNVCADAIVNSALAHLAWLQLPPGAVRLEGLLDSALGQPQSAEAALLAWDVERLYLAVDDRQSGGKSSSKSAKDQGQGKRQSQSQSEVQALVDGPRARRARALAQPEAADLQPVPGGEGGLDGPQDEAQATRTWGQRLLRAHAGDGDQSMLRALLADLPRWRTPWELALRAQLAHGLSKKPGLSWSRPARSWLANQGRTVGGRRLPWEPGVSAVRPVARLVVVVDVSGSVDAALMERFAGEIESISRRLEATLVLVVGDDRVRQVQTFEPGLSDLRRIPFHGGGGTDFTPLLEEAQAHRPDITVVLTDLEGPARYRPRSPVIWAVPEASRHAVAPFGRVLVLQ
jgi:predicted metal-dependent peptidase